MKRFEVWQANLPCRDNSSIQQGCRPIIIVSNDHANQHSPVVTVVPLTSKAKKALPTHVTFVIKGLTRVSTALCEQVTSIDKNVLSRCIGYVDDPSLRRALCHALSVQLGA